MLSSKSIPGHANAKARRKDRPTRCLRLVSVSLSLSLSLSLSVSSPSHSRCRGPRRPRLGVLPLLWRHVGDEEEELPRETLGRLWLGWLGGLGERGGSHPGSPHIAPSDWCDQCVYGVWILLFDAFTCHFVSMMGLATGPVARVRPIATVHAYGVLALKFTKAQHDSTAPTHQVR